jgi:hypothetical protein
MHLNVHLLTLYGARIRSTVDNAFMGPPFGPLPRPMVIVSHGQQSLFMPLVGSQHLEFGSLAL